MTSPSLPKRRHEHPPSTPCKLPSRQRTKPDLPVRRSRFKQAPSPAKTRDHLSPSKLTTTTAHKIIHTPDSHNAMPSSPNANNPTLPSNGDLNSHVFSLVMEKISQHILVRRKQRLEATVNNRVITHVNTLSAAKKQRSTTRPPLNAAAPSRPASHSKPHRSPPHTSSALVDLNYYLHGPPTNAKQPAARPSPTPSPASSQNASQSLNPALSETSTDPLHPPSNSPLPSPCPRPQNPSNQSPNSSTEPDKDERPIPRKRPRPKSHHSHPLERQDTTRSLPTKRSRKSPRPSSSATRCRSTTSRFSDLPREPSPAHLHIRLHPLAPPSPKEDAPPAIDLSPRFSKHPRDQSPEGFKLKLRPPTPPSPKEDAVPAIQLSPRVETAPKLQVKVPKPRSRTPQPPPVEPEHSSGSCTGDALAQASVPSEDDKAGGDYDTGAVNVAHEETDHTATCARTAGYRRKDWERNEPPDLSRYRRQRGQVTFSSRDNRLQNRKFRKGISQIDPNHDLLNMDLLKRRKRDVQFRKSPIHGMGLFARETIESGEFVLEYIGEVIRKQVANLREERYTRRGMGDSYLFRLTNDLVVDATQRGCIARFINHSCDPNLVAKIISIRAKSHIMFYSKRRIKPDEELTYDYKFDYEAEDKKIDCLCKASACRRFLN